MMDVVLMFHRRLREQSKRLVKVILMAIVMDTDLRGKKDVVAAYRSRWAIRVSDACLFHCPWISVDILPLSTTISNRAEQPRCHLHHEPP